MQQLQNVGKLLSGMNVDAFVRFEDRNVFVEMASPEYQRCQEMLAPWFIVLKTDKRSVLLVETPRGLIDR